LKKKLFFLKVFINKKKKRLLTSILFKKMQGRKTISLSNVTKNVPISTVLNNIPHKQIMCYYNALILSKALPYNVKLEDAANEIKEQILTITYEIPICSGCMKKDKETLFKLQLCEKCYLEWYCSNECQMAHRHVHQKYCCNIDGDWPEDSPFRPAIIKIVH
jgi:hypothetical protein